MLEVALENPCDPDRRPRAGAGVGLENVKRRLAAAFGSEARINIHESAEQFRVELTLPLAPGGAGTDVESERLKVEG